MGSPDFILPDKTLVERAAVGDGNSYAIYNYYGSGPIVRAKRRRFRQALSMGVEIGADRAIDMGCADGLLLPSLSRLYDSVQAIDIDASFVRRSARLVDELSLDNVNTICSAGLSVSELSEQIGRGYRVMYLLETLEHVGQQPDIWRTKIKFLRDCFSLLESNGQIVVSVPKMVGMIVLFKNTLQRILGLGYDPLTLQQLLRSAFLKNTDDLEPLWDGHHIGFNHLKLDRHLQKSFIIHDRKESAISVFYRLGLASHGCPS